jgi:HSP20 family protein
MNALTRFDRFEDLFPMLWRRAMQPMPGHLEPIGEIRVDIDETDKEYLVRAEIPGAKKDDIRVEIDGNRVAIAAEVRKDYEETDKNDKNRVLVREALPR